MDGAILSALGKITDEEKKIIAGKKRIDRELYMLGQNNVISSKKLVSPESLITIRTHTRFIDFPEHTHDYVEIVYMCSGETTHIVNGKKIVLKAGELLFINQSARHEVLRAEKDDIAVNFITVPEFFFFSLSVIGEEETPLRRFLVDCICGDRGAPEYLHFRVADIRPIQNLAENLILTFLEDTPFKQKTAQIIMSLLFLQLIGYTEKISYENEDDDSLLAVLRYIERNYAHASLKEAARELHYEQSSLSREIKRKTGKTYTELLQERRLAQAVFLLKNTDGNIDEISRAVGYENVSYFHRIFYSAYKKTPAQFRRENSGR